MLEYPFQFKLDDGTNIVVNTTNTIVYQFDVTETTGARFNFDWHVFKGKEGQPEKNLKVLDTYTRILDAQRVVAMN